MDSIHNLSNNQPINVTDLCDDVLLEIFSYLNLTDGIKLPLVCKRFSYYIQQNNLPVSTASSTELETLKLSAKKKNLSYDRIFEKLGSHLKTFSVDSNDDAFEVDLIMKSIGKYCHKVKTMVVRFLYANVVKRLPKSLENLTASDFLGRCLDVTALTHLDKLSLMSSHALDEVKVHRPLKEFHLQLRLGVRMPNEANINRLTAVVSEKFDVKLHSDYSDAGYFYAGRIFDISLDDLNRIMNLKLFTVNLFFARIHGIHPTNVRSTKMLCNCDHSIHLSLADMYIILDNYHGPERTPATRVIRYTPGTSLSIEFGFDDYVDRYKYFKRLRLGFPNCHCASVEVRILLELLSF